MNKNKQRLFEVFEKVNKVNLKEWYNKLNSGDFNNIDWKVLHDQLMLNTKLIKIGSRCIEKDLAATVDELTDSDGMLSLEELQYLNNFELININGMFSNIGGQFPIIENKRYFDFNVFKAKAAEIWNKELPLIAED